ncbi:MAG: magnesium/cobalt transporter CorA [Candidatus Kapabacteria bacterium]|nr:magnesium/cobalt transporter CorA [Candidatus Kapabacteria bacterium]
MIEIRLYKDGRILTIPREELGLHAESSLSEEEMIWVDLIDPSREEELFVLSSFFPVHELVLEDMHHAISQSESHMLHHPKIEDYGTYLFVIMHSMIPPSTKTDNVLNYLNAMDEAQLNILVGKRVLITHHGKQIGAADNLRGSCARNPLLMRRGPDYLLHLLLDDLVDDYLPLVQLLDERIEELERNVFTKPGNTTLVRVLSVKRELQKVRRVLAYQREILSRMSRGEFALVSSEEAFYYRNVYDHLVRLTDQIDEARDLAMSIMEAYFSVSSARLNQVMKVLTVFSTVFLPITFITSLYGMNFQFMPELRQEWGYPAVIAVIIATVVSMVFFFKRRGWLD